MAGRIYERPLRTRLLQKLQGDISTDSLSCSIFKVPNHLRLISEKAYEPQVISIGPYHHGKGQLMAMEVHKMFYLKMLLERIPEISLERYVTALKSMEKEARKFYSEPLNYISGEAFVGMMLLDGCFIIELIRKSAMEELRSENDHLLTHFLLRRVMRDLLLVENQLPFFILSELFGMTVISNDKAKDFMDMAINFFSRMMPGSQIGRSKNDQDIKHLLGLLHDSCQAPSPDCQEVRISCSPKKVRSLSPKAKLNCNSSEVVRRSPPEPLALGRGMAEGAPFVGFPPPLESSEVKFSPFYLDNYLHCQAATAPSTSFFPTKSSEESVFTVAPLVTFSAPYSSKEVKFLPSNSSHLCYLQELDALDAQLSISTSPLKSSEEEEIVPNVSMGAAPLTATERDSTRALGPKRNEKWRFIRSATELSEAGINFKKIEGRLFDIEFEKGVMSIPTLSINDDTESIFRNLVAYEQCFKGASSKCFTDYITFMDCLINTGKDVELLCLHGVINNWLGDYEVVAAIFNKLRDSVLISEEDFSYAETFNEVNKHCNRKWNLWKANLWHNYFNTPWAGISFLAAVFLLLFTALQSVYAVLSYHCK